MTMLPFDVFELEQSYPVECWRCDATDEITGLMKVAENFKGSQVNKELGESMWLPDGSGWLCPLCADEKEERDRRLAGPEVTVPKPPNEWRFCQSCGSKIDSTKLEGQFCGGCST